MVETIETRIGIGRTDYGRLIGVTPPLTDSEMNAMRYDQVIDSPHEITQVIMLEPPCTLITAGSAPDNSPAERTQHAQTKANRIATALGALRDGEVTVNEKPLYMMGTNSSPFNPDPA